MPKPHAHRGVVARVIDGGAVGDGARAWEQGVRQRAAREHIVELQQIALEAIRPAIGRAHGGGQVDQGPPIDQRGEGRRGGDVIEVAGVKMGFYND